MAPSAEDRIRALKSKRETFKAELLLFKSHLDSDVASINAIETKFRLDDIESEYASFAKTQSELDHVGESQVLLQERLEIKDLYMKCRGRAHCIIQAAEAEKTHAQTAQHPQPGSVGRDSDVALPQFNLPTFSGNCEDWPGFADQFKSAVHNKAQLSDTKKLLYLRASLTGEAALWIKSLGNSAANYEAAWAMLEREYNKPALIVSKHLRALFELSPIVKSTYEELRQFLISLDSHYRALRAMEQPSADTILVQLCVAKLDKLTNLKWKEHTRNTEFPTVDEFVLFLHTRCHDLEPSGFAPLINQSEPKHGHEQRGTRSAKGTRNDRPGPQTIQAPPQRVFKTQTVQTCSICEQQHKPHACPQLLKLPVSDRLRFVESRRLCINCLRGNHTEPSCSGGTCRVCQRRHHTVLHTDQVQPSPASSSGTTVLTTSVSSQVLLSTAIVHVFDTKGIAHPCRVLLDSCSQSHFLTTEFASRLALPERSVDLPLSGLNNMNSRIAKSTTATVGSRSTGYQRKLTFLLTKTIADQVPDKPVKVDRILIPTQVRLADPQFSTPAAIDGLLGAQIFWELLQAGQIAIPNTRIRLQNTRLGWVVTGEETSPLPLSRTVCNTTRNTLDRQVARFWEIEEIPNQPPLSPEEKACERHYILHTTRDKTSGRYCVSLPFRDTVPNLGQSHPTALKRFFALERSLARNPHVRAQYIEFMREYENLGHMTRVPHERSPSGYFIPHHGVTKADSVTTKLRVVFDASTPSSTGISLNDCLMVGPTIQPDLFTILLRFRQHPVVITADISKMYRQIQLRDEDRKYQRILWREHATEPIQTFQLNTVTYGTACAPYLAIRTLHQVALDYGTEFPKAAAAIRDNFYVDDLLAGANSIDEAKRLRDELIELTRLGGFELRQWVSNEPQVMASLPTHEGITHFSLKFEESKKTLGMVWTPNTDDLSYTIKQPTPLAKVTKRIILSRIAELFDPLGLLGPVIVKAKILLQELWKFDVNWDESTPVDITMAWTQLEAQLPLLNQICFPRCLVRKNAFTVELHGFCDASEKAYGACVYLTSKDHAGVSQSRLVCAKSRVAPLKTQSLPRLELCAAHLLSKLTQTVTRALKDVINRTVLWSDSTITLCWIATSPHRLQTFVANRVSDIQDRCATCTWRHVPTQDNPADCLSRGLAPGELLGHALWSTGPAWLSKEESQWPAAVTIDTSVPELRTTSLVSRQTSRSDLFSRFSSFRRLVRVVAYCFRFSTNAGGRTRLVGPLTPQELRSSISHLCRIAQRESFREDIEILNRDPRMYKGGLSRLSPFLDDEGILRVGGRISRAQVSYSQKHPVLLSHTHPLTALVIRDCHVQQLHAGPQATLNAIRQRFWITNGRSIVSRHIRSCIRCLRAKPELAGCKMAALPGDRVNLTRAFTIVGIDYCGPLFIKEKRTRNTRRIKTYVAIFVCFATKAVHIELVSDLTTDAFVAALKRFISRRGHPSDIYSDNARTFIGANRELLEMLQEVLNCTENPVVRDYLSTRGITWHFIPPRAPHFGGLWEAAVKSAKRHLIRVIGNALLTYEALSTVLTEIESILNSRPLTPLSSNPNDYSALTPGHFLIGESMTGIVETDATHIPASRLSLWQHVLQIRRHFWNRWHREYLNELTVRKAWHKDTPHGIKEGTVVILKEDNLPPLCWPLGRVIATHPGTDHIVRVVTVKTATGTYKRSVRRLAPLPVDTPDAPDQDAVQVI